MKALIWGVDFTCRYGGNAVLDGWAGLVGWLLNGVGWAPSCTAGSACLPDGWLLPGTIKAPFSERVLLILVGAHSLNGGCRVPKSTVKGRASLCKHFPRLFAMQGKSYGQARFQELRNKLRLLMGGATESHC